jgi:hypothetical protein
MAGSGQPKKSVDLTQVDPDYVDGSGGTPFGRTGERVMVRVDSGVATLLVGVLGGAWFIHTQLGVVDGMRSVGLSLLVVVVVSTPTKKIGQLLRKIMS